MNMRHFPRLTLHRIGKDDGFNAVAAGFSCRRFQRNGSRGDDTHLVSGENPVVRLRRVRILAFDMCECRLRQIQPITLDDLQGLIAAGFIRHGWAGGHESRIVARNIRDNQRKHLCRVGCSKPAPLMVDRCLRTAFMAEMGAPEASSALLTAISSSSVMPSGGDGSRADPPPEISATTRSSSLNPDTALNSRLEAASPAPSGTGCAASMILMRSQGAP